MQIGQTIRRIGRGMRARVADMRGGSGATAASAGASDAPRRGITGRVILFTLLVIALFYPAMAWLTHTIDDDLNFQSEAQILPGQSRTAAMMAALIRREVDDHGWIANNPFFVPTALLDNMPNYQTGMVQALGRFAFELADQLGRTRGSSQIDPDLQSAAGMLQYPPDVWVWDPSVSIWPRSTSEAEYRKAARTLSAYNERLAQGSAVFDRRADNLLAALDRIAQDLGSVSAVIEEHVRTKSGFPLHNKADDVFYDAKGRLYAYAMILKELGRDFEPVIRERELAQVWSQMMDTFQEAVRLQPLVVLNGAPDSQLVPCPLCAQGFYILRARTQLREVTNILQK